MSSTQDIYLLDANVFIEAAKHYYGFDLVPSFWRELVDKGREGRIISIDKVKAELDDKEDILKQWAGDDFAQWFEMTNTKDVLVAYKKVMEWIEESDFSDKAKKDFTNKNKADAWIVAYAMTRGCVVVTHEQFKPGIKRKVPIPNACRKFGVKSINTFQMLHDLDITLG